MRKLMRHHSHSVLNHFQQISSENTIRNILFHSFTTIFQKNTIILYMGLLLREIAILSIAIMWSVRRFRPPKKIPVQYCSTSSSVISAKPPRDSSSSLQFLCVSAGVAVCSGLTGEVLQRVHRARTHRFPKNTSPKKRKRRQKKKIEEMST